MTKQEQITCGKIKPSILWMCVCVRIYTKVSISSHTHTHTHTHNIHIHTDIPISVSYQTFLFVSIVPLCTKAQNTACTNICIHHIHTCTYYQQQCSHDTHTHPQVRRKVSKEQNTVVQVKNEGNVDLKMRVFVSNSVEAGAISEYIEGHSTQTPAPFVVLSRHMPMAVTYDPNMIDPGVASVADRLRKQIKTYAVKVLREAIADKRCNLDTSVLRGHRGPLAPAEAIAGIVSERATAIENDPNRM